MLRSSKRMLRLLFGLVLLAWSSGEARGQAVEGQNVLAIGHSFFVPVARLLDEHAARAGVVGHTQSEVFSGGETGTPSSLWENDTKKAEILAILNTGTVDVFAMTYDPDSEGYEEWISAALAANPNTKIYLGLPWIDYPSDWTTELYVSTWLTAHRTAWPNVLESLRALYPGVEIHNLAYGQAAIELRQLFEDGNLPDVSSMTGASESAIFTDYKGHAGQIVKDTAVMVWLSTIYGIDLDDYAWDHGYTTDIRQIAREIVEEDQQLTTTGVLTTKFMLRDDAGPLPDANKRRFSFRSSPQKGEPSGVISPDFGSISDPTTGGESGGGATLTIYANGDTLDEAVQFSLPALLWERKGSPFRPGYSYKDRGRAEGPIQKIVLRSGKLSISGSGAGLYPLNDAPQGEMVLRLKLATGMEFCATTWARIPMDRHDSTAKFNGQKGSPAPTECPQLAPASGGSASQAFLAETASLLD